MHCWWEFKQGSLVICLYPVVKPLLVWRDDSERNRALFPASENRLLPTEAIPGPRVNAICFLISPESELPLCLVSFYTWFAAMPDSAWHRLWSIFLLSCAISGLCFITSRNTMIRTTIPCCLPESVLLRYATDWQWCSVCAVFSCTRRGNLCLLQKCYCNLQYSDSRNLASQPLCVFGSQCC